MTLYLGSEVYRTVILRETEGKDISGVSLRMAVLPADQGTPGETDWKAPDTRETLSSSEVKAQLLFKPTVKGLHAVWIRPTDNPEVQPLVAGTFRVA